MSSFAKTAGVIATPASSSCCTRVSTRWAYPSPSKSASVYTADASARSDGVGWRRRSVTEPPAFLRAARSESVE